MTSAPAGAADEATPKPPTGADDLKQQAPTPVPGRIWDRAMAKGQYWENISIKGREFHVDCVSKILYLKKGPILES
jgi:hypothetical protein